MSVSVTVRVGSPHGLHARPATAVVRLANRYASQVTLLNADNGERADAKSIFDVMILAARHQVSLTVTAVGDDEEAAAAAVSQLIASDFGDVMSGGEGSILGGLDDHDDSDSPDDAEGGASGGGAPAMT